MYKIAESRLIVNGPLQVSAKAAEINELVESLCPNHQQGSESALVLGTK